MKYSLQLKAIQVALLVLSASVSLAQNSTRYKISVPETYLTKENLSLATDYVPNYGRYITGNKFELVLDQANAEESVRSMFESVGIPVLSVATVKEITPFREKAGGNNCESAQILCSNTSQTANSSGAGIQELTASNQGCLWIEHQSSWYYLNIQSGGSLTMNIAPNNSSDDYDFAIWGPFTEATAGVNCPPVTAPVRCSYSATGGNTGLIGSYQYTGFCSTCGFLCCVQTVTDNSEDAFGDAWVAPLTTAANQIYILLVDNYSNSGQPYNMSFGGTSVLGCTPVVLPIELVEFKSVKTSNGNVLKWMTETESRSGFFTVEWTTDPASGSWKEIAHITAKEQSQVIQNYSVFHGEPSANEINYYRLNLTDLDGSRTTFNAFVLSVDNSKEGKAVEHVFNLMGQEVDDNYQGMVIYCYSDGTTEKVYK